MSTRNKVIILLIITLLFCAGLIYFIIIPTLNDIKAIKMAIYDERADLERKYLRGQLLRKTIQDFEAIKPEAEQLQKASLQQGDELNFITTLESIAQKYTIQQEIQIAFDQVDSAKSFQKLPLSLSLEGSFEDTMNYLQSIERLGYYIPISSVQINTIGLTPADNPILKTSLAGAIYIIPSTNTQP